MCTGAAILVNALGAYRFWRQQNAMLRGKVLCGGWELQVTLAVVFLVCDVEVLVSYGTLLTWLLGCDGDLHPRGYCGYRQRVKG